MEELMIGSVGASLILTILLGIIYNTFPKINDRIKTPIAVLIGLGLGVVAMYVEATPPFSFKIWVNFLIKGLLVGASATGLYELGRSVYKPRE